MSKTGNNKLTFLVIFKLTFLVKIILTILTFFIQITNITSYLLSISSYGLFKVYKDYFLFVKRVLNIQT